MRSERHQTKRGSGHPMNAPFEIRRRQGHEDQDRSDRCADSRARKNEDDARERTLNLASCMRYAQKIMIGSKNNATQLQRLLDVLFVGRPGEACLDDAESVHVPAAKAGHDAHVHTLVDVETNGQGQPRIACSLRGAARRSQRIDQHSRLFPLSTDQLLVIVVVRERSVDRRKRQVRVCLDHFVRRHPQVLDLACDLADLDVGTGHDWTLDRGVDVPGAGVGGLHSKVLAGRGTYAAAQPLASCSKLWNDCLFHLIQRRPSTSRGKCGGPHGVRREGDGAGRERLHEAGVRASARGSRHQQNPIGLRSRLGGGLPGAAWAPQPSGATSGKMARKTETESGPTRRTKALTMVRARVGPLTGLVNTICYFHYSPEKLSRTCTATQARAMVPGAGPEGSARSAAARICAHRLRRVRAAALLKGDDLTGLPHSPFLNLGTRNAQWAVAP